MADEWWYCLRHNEVEGREGCAQAYRMGPYPSRAEAANALETAADRTEAWENDPRWNDDVEDEK